MDGLPRDATLKPGNMSPYAVQVSVDDSHLLAHVSERFLSFALDTSQVVGGKWWNPSASQVELGSGTLEAPLFDFNRSRLDLLASALAPAYLRLGGSEADKVYYNLEAGGDSRPLIPPGYHSALKRSQWDAACEFARRNGLGLVFTLNVGPASRKSDGSWDAGNAESLLTYTAQQGHQVDVWELGNEVNVFFSVHGWRSQVSPRRYAADLKSARQLLDRLATGACLASQGSAFWPVLGELPLHWVGFTRRTLKLVGSLVDQVGWHYYPQQSRRGPAATRRASPTRLLNPRYLDEVGHWADEMVRWRDQYAPGKPLWMGETGSAQFGGEPGVSDCYISGLWWLDQLGMLARTGHQVVIRQTLCGMDYGMLDDDLAPRPDYWNSLLWKLLMGQQVFAVQLRGECRKMLRAYAHSTPGASTTSVTVLVLNLDCQRSARVSFPQYNGRRFGLYYISTPDVLGSQVLLNGERLQIADAALPTLQPAWQEIVETPRIILNPLSYAFIRFAD